jgi:hypothetical protein
VALWRAAGHVVRNVRTAVSDVASWGVHAAVVTTAAVISAGSRLGRAVTRWAAPRFRKTIHILRVAAHDAAEVGRGFGAALASVPRGAIAQLQHNIGVLVRCAGAFGGVAADLPHALSDCEATWNEAGPNGPANAAVQTIRGAVATAQSIYHDFTHGRGFYGAGRILGYAAVIALTKRVGAGADTSAAGTGAAAADSGSWLSQLLAPKATAHALTAPEAGTEGGTTSLFRASPRGQSASDYANGYDPAQFPGGGNSYPDGRAYFGVNDSSIAQEYAGT